MKGKVFLAVSLPLLVIAVLPAFLSPEREDLTPAARAAAPGQFVQLSNGQVHYEIAGPANGQPVVLIHGFSVPYYLWDGAFEALAEAGFRVLRYDLYGRGYSDRPDAAYDKAFYEAQLQELLAAVQIEQPVDMVASSFGGVVAAAFAADHPEQVRRLVLMDPVALYNGAEPFYIPGVGEYLTYAALLPALPSIQLADFHDPSRAPDDWVERYRVQLRYRGFGRALLRSIRNTIRDGAVKEYQRVGSLDLPVLLIWGEEDHTAAFEQHTLALEALGHATFFPVPDAGHLPHIERPELVLPRLIEFLGSA